MENDLSFEQRLDEITQRMEAACVRAGRDIVDVTLVAVSKTFPPEAVMEAQRAGVRIFGESRMQEALAKIDQCGSAEWHFVGHLQSNKIRPALEFFSMIHSVDSFKLLDTLATAMEETGHRPKLLLEVNAAGEGSKFGFKLSDIPAALQRAQELGLPVSGFMTLPPFTPDPEGARKYFRTLRELRDRCQDDTGLALPELSMGMSHDFEVAIEEGTTMIRVGTALFGERKAWKIENGEI